MKLFVLIVLICIYIIPQSKGQSFRQLSEYLHKIKETIASSFKKIEEDMEEKANKVMFRILFMSREFHMAIENSK